MTEVRSLKKIYFILALLLQILLLFLLPEEHESREEWSVTVTIYSVIALIFQLISLKFILPPKSYLIPTFVILSYLFNFGQIFVEAAGYEMPELILSQSIWKNSGVYHAATLALESIAGLFLGIIFYYTFIYKGIKLKEAIKNVVEPRITFVILLLIIGFVCDLAYTIHTSFTLGYGEVEVRDNFYYIVRLFSYLFPTAIAFLLTRQKIPLDTKTTILVFFLVYKFISIFSGYRGFPVINIILILYLYFKVCRSIKITLGKAAILIGAGVLGISLLVAVRETRVSGVDVGLIIDIITNTDNNVFFNILAENGVTLNPLCAVVDEKGGEGVGGWQFITSMMSIIPSVKTFFPNIDYNNLQLDTALDMRHFGGSYISDLCFDFGEVGLLPSSILLGLAVSACIGAFDSAIIRKRFVYVSFMFPIIVDLFFCIRSTLSKMPRNIVWYLILFYILWILFSGRGVRKLFKELVSVK